MILGCIPSWTSQTNTNVLNGQSYEATNLTACQDACYNSAVCTGVDWDPSNQRGQYCWLSGPWSSRRNDNGAPGITHYDLTRYCGGKTSYVYMHSTHYRIVQQMNVKCILTFKPKSFYLNLLVIILHRKKPHAIYLNMYKLYL